MALSALALRQAKPGAKDQKLFDGGGLFLLVRPNGSKLWRIKFRFAGREQLLSLGEYPVVSLADARNQRQLIKDQLARGVNPADVRRAHKRAQSEAAANSFEAVAREWLECVHSKKVVQSHYERNVRRLEMHVFPRLGRRPIADIEPPELLDILRSVERREHQETANRLRTLAGQIFRYAIGTGRAERDIAADLRGALAQAKTKHRVALLEPDEIGGLMRAIEGYSGHEVTRAALKLAPLVFVRPGELRNARWDQFDLAEEIWNYSPSKNGVPVVTPLPVQAIELLTQLRQITGRSEYVFHGVRSAHRPISNNTLNAALHNMWYKDRMTAHGFRAMARTVLVERLGFNVEYVEQQLAHAVPDANGRAYNRTQYLDQRRAMLQSWADYLDALQSGSDKVTPLHRSGSAA